MDGIGDTTRIAEYNFSECSAKSSIIVNINEIAIFPITLIPPTMSNVVVGLACAWNTCISFLLLFHFPIISFTIILYCKKILATIISTAGISWGPTKNGATVTEWSSSTKSHTMYINRYNDVNHYCQNSQHSPDCYQYTDNCSCCHNVSVMKRDLHVCVVRLILGSSWAPLLWMLLFHHSNWEATIAVTYKISWQNFMIWHSFFVLYKSS